MNAITLKSVLQPGKVGYRLSDDYDWQVRGNAPLSYYITQFDTYGDGLIQHSGAFCSQWSNLTDVCLSLTAAVLADPLNPSWKQLDMIFRGTSKALIEFVRTIKFREDKDQWFSLSERKLTTSKSKQFDRRWEKVESWMDGSAGASVSIILKDESHIDWLQKLAWAQDVREAYSYSDWEETFKPVKDLTGDWYAAFTAIRQVAEAIRLLDNLRRQMECALTNSKPKEEAKVAA